MSFVNLFPPCYVKRRNLKKKKKTWVLKLLLLTVSSEALQFLKIFKVRCTPNYSLLQLCLSSLVQKPGIFSYMLHFHYCLTKYEGQYLDIFNLPRNKNCDCSFLYIFLQSHSRGQCILNTQTRLGDWDTLAKSSSLLLLLIICSSLYL